MKNFKKIIILLLVVIIVGGCSNKVLTNVYKKMQAGEKTINGYSIDLRIYGTVDNTSINEIIRISNYNDKDFKITIVNKDIRNRQEGENYNPLDNDTIVYVKDGKTYIKDNETYKETSEKQKYTNPLIYLEGLKNVKEITSESEETIANNKYNVYNIVVKEETAKSILEEIDLNVALNGDIEAKVYVNEEGYLYRIIYYMEGITVNVNYFGINASVEIILPQ